MQTKASSTIVLDNITAAEIADKLKTLPRGKRYAVSIQDMADRRAILDEMEKATNASKYDIAASRSESEVMSMVNETIEKYRSKKAA